MDIRDIAIFCLMFAVIIQIFIIRAMRLQAAELEKLNGTLVGEINKITEALRDNKIDGGMGE